MTAATRIGVYTRPAPKKVLASRLFIFVSVLLLISVNVRVLGTLGAALNVALCLCILYLGRTDLLNRIIRQPIIILLPCLYVFSFVWSDELKVSFSLGLQTLLTVLTAVTVAQCSSHRQFLLIIFMATAAVCLGCIAHGGMGPSDTGMVLVGFLGSKDSMGLFAYCGAITSLAIMVDSERRSSLRIFALCVGLVETGIVLNVHATTAVLSLVMAIALFWGTYRILARYKTARWISYVFLFFFAMLAIGLGAEIIELFMDTASHQLGKDATLTGRTVLWGEAINLFIDSPLVGHGYRAFWAGSSPETQRMLASMGMTDGRSFHFHEQYLEVLVDTGIFGELILVSTLSIFVRRAWKKAMNYPSYFTAYSLAIMIVYVIRLFFETAFLPFSFDMMLIFGLGAAALGKSELYSEEPSPKKKTKPAGPKYPQLMNPAKEPAHIKGHKPLLKRP